MEDKIIVSNTHICITNYTMGDCEQLENIFRTFDPVTHKFNSFGMYYDKDNKRLYIPAGIDLWRIKRMFEQKYYKREIHHKYQSIDNILIKAKPRDDEQRQALRFMCGVNEYSDNYELAQLSVNLNTGKGKTYCSIASICFFRIKSVIITGSTTLLNQWAQEIMRYTNLTMKDISLFREEILIGTIPNYLHVTEESQCEKISENTWKSIVVESGLCNSMTGDLRIENYPNLYNLIVKQQSLMNLNSLTITNNPYLSYFGTDATLFLYHNGTFGNVKNVEISRLLFFYSFILR